MKNNITNEQIIQSARRQRQTVNNRIDVEPWQSHHRKDRGMAVAIAVAASLISFIAGYGLHSKMAQPDKQSLAQTIQVQHDTIMQIETIRDTVYQTGCHPIQGTPCDSEHRRTTILYPNPTVGC